MSLSGTFAKSAQVSLLFCNIEADKRVRIKSMRHFFFC